MTGVMNIFLKVTQQFSWTHVTSFTDSYSVCEFGSIDEYIVISYLL
jgi:hypothetical protein